MNTVCPNCERFIGTSEECPFCGFDDVTPRFLKLFRRAAFCLALFGLISLTIMSFCRDLPLVQAGRITPMMNYAPVRAIGTTTTDTFIGNKIKSKPYISFYLRDSTGDIKVVAYGNTAQQIISDGTMPHKNDRVEIEGRLRVEADGKITLMLNKISFMNRDRDSTQISNSDTDTAEGKALP